MMQPFFINGWSSGSQSNALLSDLSAYVASLIKKQTVEIDTPEFLQDLVNEWLGEHSPTYKRCRWQSVVMLVRPYRPHWNSSQHCPCLRIYYESQDGFSLYPHLLIGFRLLA